MEVSNELIEKVREVFDRDPRVIDMRIRQNQLQSMGDYAGALNLGRRIDGLFKESVRQYVKRIEDDVERFEVGSLPMSEEDKDKVYILSLAAFMACDIMEFAVMEVDDILKKYGKDLHYDFFDDLHEVSRFAKEKQKFLRKNSGIMESPIWGDACDDMFEMIKNKSNSLKRKYERV